MIDFDATVVCTLLDPRFTRIDGKTIRQTRTTQRSRSRRPQDIAWSLEREMWRKPGRIRILFHDRAMGVLVYTHEVEGDQSALLMQARYEEV
jgi:hypothetical protein